MGDTPTPLWGRAWYHLLCSEIAEAARWYEKMIDAREIFAPVYATSLYTMELPCEPLLGQVGAHDEPAGVAGLRGMRSAMS